MKRQADKIDPIRSKFNTITKEHEQVWRKKVGDVIKVCQKIQKVPFLSSQLPLERQGDKLELK